MVGPAGARPAGGPWPLVVLMLGLLAGCTTPPQTRAVLDAPPSSIARARQLADVPFFPQRAYQCGPAALAMLLAPSGLTVLPDDLTARVYVPGRQGSFQPEMLAATRHYDRLALEVGQNLESLLQWLGHGEPVLVLQNLGPDWYPVWHYSVVIGYDLDRAQLVLHSGETAWYRVSLAIFERTWQRAGFWGMVALKPGELPYSGDSPDAYFRAAAALEETRLDADMGAVWAAGAAAWPDSPDIRAGMANHVYSLGERGRALQLYESLLADFPDYLPAYNNLASIQAETGLLDEALRTARRGLEIAGGSHPYLEATLAEIRAAIARQQ